MSSQGDSAPFAATCGGCCAPIGDVRRPVVLDRHESPLAVVALGRTSIGGFAAALHRQCGYVAGTPVYYCTACIMLQWIEAGAPKPKEAR